MKMRTRKKVLIICTIFMILLGILLVQGWIVLFLDILDDFSPKKLVPLAAIPSAIFLGIVKVKNIWRLFEITEILNGAKKSEEK